MQQAVVCLRIILVLCVRLKNTFVDAFDETKTHLFSKVITTLDSTIFISFYLARGLCFAAIILRELSSIPLILVAVIN